MWPLFKGRNWRRKDAQEEPCSEFEPTRTQGLIKAYGFDKEVARSTGNNAPPPVKCSEGKTAYLKVTRIGMVETRSPKVTQPSKGHRMGVRLGGKSWSFDL